MRIRLVALCVALTVTEAVVAGAFHVPGGLAIAPQAAAPPPLGIFQDLRWIFVYERSWLGFALEVGGVLAARTAVTYWSLRWSWPKGVAVPSSGRLWCRAGVFTLASGALLAPFALLLFAFAAFPVSWLFYGAFPPAVILALLVHGASVSKTSWRALPPIRAVAWLLGAVAGLSALGALSSLDGGSLAIGIVVAFAAGFFDAWCWSRIVAAVVLRPAPRRAVPVPVFAVVFLCLSFVGVKLGFLAAREPPVSASPAATSTSVSPGVQAVLYASGFASHWSGQSLAFPTEQRGIVVVPFSYRGMGPNGEPLHYTAPETQQPIGRLVALMAAQVRTLRQRTGRPVVVVGESEGSAIVEAYLRRWPDAPVRLAVVVSPLSGSGSVTYPSTGNQGWGVAAGAGLQMIGDALRPLSTINLAPTDPFLRSLVSDPVGAGALSSKRHRRTGLVIVPVADTVANALPASGAREKVLVVPGFHGGNLLDPAATKPIGVALRGREPSGSSSLELLGRVIGDLASGWHVPALRHLVST